jgi:hypothetical protein
MIGLHRGLFDVPLCSKALEKRQRRVWWCLILIDVALGASVGTSPYDWSVDMRYASCEFPCWWSHQIKCEIERPGRRSFQHCRKTRQLQTESSAISLSVLFYRVRDNAPTRWWQSLTDPSSDAFMAIRIYLTTISFPREDSATIKLIPNPSFEALSPSRFSHRKQQFKFLQPSRLLNLDRQNSDSSFSSRHADPNKSKR